MKTDDKAIADGIVAAVGGVGNIRAVGHCSTRLRLTLHDKTKVDEKTIEDIEGVKGQFFAGEQYQVILGTGLVNRVYGIVAGENQGGVNTDIKADLYAGMSLPKKLSLFPLFPSWWQQVFLAASLTASTRLAFRWTPTF